MIIYLLGVRLSESAKEYIEKRPSLKKICDYLEDKFDHDRAYYHRVAPLLEYDVEMLSKQSEFYRYNSMGFTGIEQEDREYREYLNLKQVYENSYFPHTTKVDFHKLSLKAKMVYGEVRSKVDACLGLEPSKWMDEPLYSLDDILSIL